MSRRNHFANIRIDGIVGGVRKGFRIGGGRDANNDFHLFENVTVANYRDVAYSIENSQVYGVTFLNCLFEGGPSSQVGVATDRGSGKGGNFSWIGGGGGGNKIADFSIGDPNNGPISIVNAIFETSARLLKTGGPSGASFLFRVEGIRRRPADGSRFADRLRSEQAAEGIMESRRFSQRRPFRLREQCRNACSRDTALHRPTTDQNDR